MNPAITKTLSLFALILIGWFLQRKLRSREELGGIKMLILSVALPATIFLALLKVDVDRQLLILPILALALNGIMLGLTWLLFPALTGEDRESPTMRTLLMLIPSLAPGLSCFPFVAEYLGEAPLAKAALADVGNKVFVLILLYILAMRWHYANQRQERQPSGNRIRALLRSLASEPVNLVILTALGMLALGWRVDALPLFAQDVVNRLGLLMTPLVLLFIGMAVRIKARQFVDVFSWLLVRAGLGFLLSAAIIWAAPLEGSMALLALLLPQSAASFWPFAHMSAVQGLENNTRKTSNFTFDTGLALNILALSLPFSTLIMLGLCTVSMPSMPVQPSLFLGIGALAIGLGIQLVKGRSITKSVSFRKGFGGQKDRESESQTAKELHLAES